MLPLGIIIFAIVYFTICFFICFNTAKRIKKAKEYLSSLQAEIDEVNKLIASKSAIKNEIDSLQEIAIKMKNSADDAAEAYR